MKVEPVDLAARLEEMAAQLNRAREPQPLGAFDAIDLQAAAELIRRLRVKLDGEAKP